MQDISNDMEPRRTNKRWAIIALSCAMALVLIIERAGVSVAAPFLMKEYGLTPVQMGWIFSSFTLAYSLIGIPGGYLADRYGIRIVLTGAILIWAVATMALTIADLIFLTDWIGVLAVLIIFRAIIGVGEGITGPTYIRAAANWVAPQERARSLALIQGSQSLGMALSPPLAAYAMLTWGWKPSFLVIGALGLPLALIWFLFVRNWPDNHPGVNEAELEYIRDGNLEAQSAGASHSDVKAEIDWKDLLRSRDFRLLLTITLCTGYTSYFYFSWFFVYLTEVRNFSIFESGFYTSFPFVASALLCPLSGWLSDHLRAKYGVRAGCCWLAGAIGLTAALAILGGVLAASDLAAVGFFTIGAASTIAVGNLIYVTGIELGRGRAGLAAGILSLIGHLGGLISPILIPALATNHGWGAGILISSALMLFTVVLWFFVDPARAIEKSRPAAAGL